MLETTLNKIKAYNPCTDGWEKLLAFLGKTKADDEPLPLLTILESNGIRNAVWALRAVEDMAGPIRLFACFCARYSLDIFEREHPDDDRPRRAIETAERFARGQATVEELEEAGAVVEVVVGAAAWAAAGAAARAAALAPAGDAAWVAVRAAAGASAGTAAWDAAWDAFTEEFKRLCVLGENYEHS